MSLTALPTRESAPAHDALNERRRQCQQMLFVVMVSYLIDGTLLLAFYAQDVVEWAVPGAYLAAGLAVCGIFSLLLRQPHSERLNDPYLLVPQMMAHSAINLGFMLWVPQIGALLLMMLLLIHAFGSLRVARLHMVISSLLIAAGVGMVMAWADDHLALPMGTWQQRALSGVWFTVILARSTILDLYGTQLRDLLVQRNAKLAATFRKLNRRANRDGLTGTLNRRSVMKLLENQHKRVELTGQTFGIVLLDIDHFKQVNDRFGHQVGDEVLRYFSRRAAAEMRTTDKLGRYGGEEFLAVLTATEDESAAHLAAERIRDGVARHAWHRLAPDLRVTVSLGVAVCQAEETIEDLLRRADAALYRAKRDGRNCVRMAERPRPALVA